MQNYLSQSARRPETRLLAAISGLWMSRLVGFAAKLGLFEAIAVGSGRVPEIARENNLAEDALLRAFEGLATLGLLRSNDGCFSLTEDGRLMLPGAHGGLNHMAALWHELFDGAWAEFETTIRTGEPGFTIRHGEPIFARVGRDAATAAHFDGAMRGLSQLIAKDASAAIIKRMRGAGHASLCDVGGGSGFLISNIAEEYPEIDCLLFDLPQVIDACRAAVQAQGVIACSGSFFQSVPQADAHVLSNVLHDWPDDKAIEILRNVRRGEDHRATLFLLEMMLGGDSEPLLARSTDLNMLVLTGGRERTRLEFDTLLAKAGYSVVSVEPVSDFSCLLIAVPQGKI
ncbi:methyltransferase [Mesorhizobium helmanticense]|uniref:O-methyltransferase C-terminal domain-containing protein n=1 Tax=Mesorhizobium helmanticense TaxID=1776423 RepID=A0A2T4ILX9_9HYPH|nr:methyltransferase [Mesorhizobium helmanticense]PTE06651.1 hypothetical protein C9427_30455 [Mesorhizobium helmanticense]